LYLITVSSDQSTHILPCLDFNCCRSGQSVIRL